MSATAVAVRERPILFSGEMVRAILDGRKTQTRRVMKPQPTREHSSTGPMWGHAEVAGYFADHVAGACFAKLIPCPHGPVGDRLWVREALRQTEDESTWTYEADGAPVELDADDPRVSAMHSWAYHNDRDRCASIHMPRWASRLTLEIAGVRVERLQDITIADALAEGADPHENGAHACHWYITLWDSLNAKRGYLWSSNPWVWVLEFARARQ